MFTQRKKWHQKLMDERHRNSNLIRQNIKLSEANAELVALNHDLRREAKKQIETSMELKKEALYWERKYKTLQENMNE